jgi:hypothetical protein
VNVNGEALKAKLVEVGFTFLAFLLCAYCETRAFISYAPLIMRTGALAAVLIFTHNSLAAVTVMVGMLFCSYLVEAMPEKYRRRGDVLKHPRATCAVLSAFIIANSLLVLGWPINAEAVLYSLPVAAIEAYGVYLAAFTGVRRCVSIKNMGKVYSVFFAGAVLETLMMSYLSA